MALQYRERDFEKVGGLKHHIEVLKEMIIYPLLYREVFEGYGIESPRGILFHGPPGTGKTLTAGAVAAECNKSANRRVAFYMRKGADCLNKYVGESEKRLQDLFAQAYKTSPSIIFFDEIDGLAPSRSESQEVYASVVSTLLALMDGLDSKSKVFVIGATNRIDMVDPALRRPGRFDRELYFPLPSLESRIQIFQIHTLNWKHKPGPDLIYKLACECCGYCGADIQFLCAQAVMKSFYRHFPQISDTTKKHAVNFRNIQVEEEDFWEAKESMVPASQRNYILPSRPLSPELEPLLRRSVENCLQHIRRSCPFKFLFHNSQDFSKNKILTCPRMLLVGNREQGHVSYIAPAVLHFFDHLPVTLIDLASFNEDSRNIIQKLEESRQSVPCIIYLRDMSSWWNLVDDTERQVLIAGIESLDSCSVSQIFIFGTVHSSYDDLPIDIKKIFPKSKSFSVSEPSKDERLVFFSQLLLERNSANPTLKKGNLGYVSFSEFNLECVSRRRSLRQRGLDVEYLGLLPESKPKLGSYYRNYVGHRDSNKRKSRSGSYKEDVELVKKLKVDEDGSCSTEKLMSSAPQEISALDHNKLEELVKTAVEVTSNCSVNSIIRLYEELEIVILRNSSEWNPSLLTQETNKLLVRVHTEEEFSDASPHRRLREIPTDVGGNALDPWQEVARSPFVQTSIFIAEGEKEETKGLE